MKMLMQQQTTMATSLITDVRCWTMGKAAWSVSGAMMIADGQYVHHGLRVSSQKNPHTKLTFELIQQV
jgi:hypothetical protein